MLAVQIGPLALPTLPLLLGLLLAASAWLASRLARRSAGKAELGQALGKEASQALLNAGFFGLLVARLAHLALHARPYLEAPLQMLDVRDGGWQGTAGLAAATAWLLWQGWRRAALRHALAVAGGAGLLLWLALSALLDSRLRSELPEITLVRLDSRQELSLHEAAAGRPLLVNLWASWCGPCRAEMPLLAAAAQRERGIGFLFVNQGESAEVVRAYLQRQGLQLPEVLLDAQSRLGPMVGSSGLPTTLFYDAQGRLLHAHLGVLNTAALQSRLDALRQR